MASSSEMTDSAGVRLLAFNVADLVFAADAALIREILPAQPATRLPGAVGPVKGLINARGSLVTVIDGRAALGFPTREDDDPIVVFDVGERSVGFTVDSVLDLFSVSAAELTEGADLLGIDPRLVKALGRRADISFVLLDVDSLLGPLMVA